MNPKVSIILPVYNSEKFLHECLESIVGQDFDSFEVLAHDDGSEDKSLGILKEFSRFDERFKISSSKNNGIVKTLNYLISASNSPYLARIDSDDICISSRIRKQYDFLERNKSIGLVGSYVECIDENGRTIREFHGPITHNEIDR
ncbi:MAG: glycosyltransferase family 2 protein, partial [Pseudomonadota bacterium]